MPISQSAKKALRSSEAKASRNRYRKALLKEALKAANASSFSVVDKATKWGIIHKNKAARLKSQLAKTIGSTPSAKKAVAKPAKAVTKKPAAKKATKK